MVDPCLIGQVIRSFRKSKDLSQEVLSGLAGLDRTHYSKIECGLRSPTVDTIFRIAGALEIPAHEIIAVIERGCRVKIAQKTKRSRRSTG